MLYLLRNIRLLTLVLLVLLTFIPVTQAQFIETKRVNMAPMIHDEWVTQIAAGPSGKELISAGADGRIVVWDTSTGTALRQISLSAIVLSVSLSADGKTIAAGDAAGKVSLIDAASAKVTSSFTADKEVVNAVAWTADSKRIVTGGKEGVLRIWSVTDGKLVGEINTSKGNVVALAFVGSQIAVGTINQKERTGGVDLWDLDTRKVVRSFDDGAPSLRSLSASPDGKILAIGQYRPSSLLFLQPDEGNSVAISLRVLPESDDPQVVGLWDAATGKRLSGLDAELGARNVAFSPDGRMLAASGANGAMIFDIVDRAFVEVGRIDSQTGVDAVVFSADSKQLFLARQRQPMAVFGGDYGLERLTDPFFTNMLMTIREGSAPTFKRSKAGPSITGGSQLEVWQVKTVSADADVKTWEAVKARMQDRNDESRKTFESVIKDHPGNARAQRLYAVLFETSDTKKVASRIEAAVKKDPTCVACFRSLGDLYIKTKDLERSRAAYERALQLQPDHGLVAGRLAHVYGQVALGYIMAGNTRENMEAASDLLGRALKLRPAEELYITNLSTIAYFGGDFDTSIKLLLIAQSLRPDHARLYYNLGHSYRQKGDKKNALAAYKQYVRLGEEGQEERIERTEQIIRDIEGE